MAGRKTCIRKRKNVSHQSPNIWFEQPSTSTSTAAISIDDDREIGAKASASIVIQDRNYCVKRCKQSSLKKSIYGQDGFNPRKLKNLRDTISQLRRKSRTYKKSLASAIKLLENGSLNFVTRDMKKVAKVFTHMQLQSKKKAKGRRFTDEQKDNRDSKDESNENQLHCVAACIFGTILEDSITMMRILVECNNSLRVTKTMADMGDLLAVKFSVPSAANIDPLAKIDPRDLGREDYKLDKLETDRNFLIDVFKSTYTELALERCFTALTEHSASLLYREQHYLKLMEDEAIDHVTRRDLNRQIRQQRVHIKTVTYDTDAIIEKLRTQVEDAALNAETESRYIGYWERARTEQLECTIADREIVPSREIEFYKQRLDFEQRVHTEFELLNNIIINETLEKVENWMNKYDKDMEGIDLRIQIMRSNYETTLEKRHELENKFEKHATLIREWIAFKEERERIRQYRERMTNSAVVVQAWWRGLLVRLKLGPYKEKPVKKKGKK